MSPRRRHPESRAERKAYSHGHGRVYSERSVRERLCVVSCVVYDLRYTCRLKVAAAPVCPYRTLSVTHRVFHSLQRMRYVCVSAS